MRPIAFFLPQFHQIPENDEWWGEGFTEWTNVKRARPVFKNQIQPKVPLNDNYYNLLDKATVEWQTDLMHEYGVYGFCYFHYWFLGKKILEKPAENLLEWTDIEQPFCFAWANVTWSRTWTVEKDLATTWVGEDKKEGPGILLEQKYGTEKDWKEHYKYLRKFFMDDRYIKVDNKPMFLIYEVPSIPDADQMFALWTELAKEDGFTGLHIVSINDEGKENQYVSAIVRYGRYRKYDKNNKLYIVYRKILKKIGLTIPNRPLNYEKVWQGMVAENPVEGIKTYPGAMVNYDETPRKGKRALYIKGASPELFGKYLSMQMKKAKDVYHSEYIFINAWNEWGEGNYLEPDVEHKYAYLEALKQALDMM